MKHLFKEICSISNIERKSRSPTVPGRLGRVNQTMVQSFVVLHRLFGKTEQEQEESRILGVRKTNSDLTIDTN